MNEIERLLQTPIPIRSEKYNYETFADYYLFICLTGIRPGDVRNLTWSNVQRANGNDFIAFTPSKTKSKVNRLLVVPLHDYASKILSRQRTKQIEPRESDKLFQGLSPESAKNTLNDFIRDWLKKANIFKRITAYNGRHSFASNLILSGVGIFEVSRLLGHTTVKHTQIYSHLTDEARRATIDKLPMLAEPNLNFERGYDTYDTSKNNFNRNESETW